MKKELRREECQIMMKLLGQKGNELSLQKKSVINFKSIRLKCDKLFEVPTKDTSTKIKTC